MKKLFSSKMGDEIKSANIFKHHGKTIIILALCLCLPFFSIWYIASYVSGNIFYEQKRENLMAFARMLDSQLASGGYDEILIGAGMRDGTKEEQIAALNAALAEITDEIAHSSEGLGVGYYSRSLDAILTYGPSDVHGNTIGISIGPDHPGRRVMATGSEEVTMGTMVRGNIMNAMLPIVRNGEVIGYIWANNLVSELEQTLSQMSFILLSLLILSYIIVMAIIVGFIRKMLSTEQKFMLALSEALEDAKVATRAKSTFLSNMSHEIRTPMNAIIGMTSIAESTEDLLRKNYAIGKIKDASKHLLSIINDVLDMSKIEAEKFVLSPVNFNFEKMLQKVADIIILRADENRQLFYVNIGKDIPCEMIGDDQRLSQVITNLLSNAVKFTPEEGTIRLDSKLVSEENGTCVIQISVSDTGIGITEEQKQRLFQSFEQAEVDTTRKFGGTGLGLVISKRIVKLMDGDIWAESEPGKGSKFIFTVKLQRGSVEDQKLLENNRHWGNLSIFVLDDEMENREYFSFLADIWGIKCTTAKTISEAEEILKVNGNFDIYFIDWMLPGTNGSEIIRHIRKKTSQKSVVIIFSSVDWADIDDEARAAGVDKFLAKPLFPSNIVDVINECIGVVTVGEQVEGRDNTDNFAGHTILLAEDVEINREIVLSLLEPTKLAVECAENGLRAVEMFKASQDRYDMIFMDVQMPVMDGYTATRTIRAIDSPKAKNIPIVAMTANVFHEDIEKCLDAGMNGHVGKPLDFDEVLKALRKHLT
ncbi:MAG: response regulator [Defluviitaleaceae bacterium]|nr:response regulator [Defluviitaleaceae bacterium]